MTDNLKHLTRLEEKIDRVIELLEEQKPGVESMKNHVEYVESYVNIMPSAASIKHYLKNSFSNIYLSGSNNRYKTLEDKTSDILS